MKASGSTSSTGAPAKPDLCAALPAGVDPFPESVKSAKILVRPTIVAAGRLTHEEGLRSEALARTADTLLGHARAGHDAALMVTDSQQLFDALRSGARLSADAAARLRNGLEGTLHVMYDSPSYVQDDVGPDAQSQVEGNTRLALERLDLAKLG